jgi:hypothetical protein
VEVGKFGRVVMRIARFGEGSLIAGGVLAVRLGFLGLVCPQGTFLQVPLFLLHSSFCIQWEEKTERPLKTLP